VPAFQNAQRYKRPFGEPQEVKSLAGLVQRHMPPNNTEPGPEV
jgi:hypothetical protein